MDKIIGCRHADLVCGLQKIARLQVLNNCGRPVRHFIVVCVVKKFRRPPAPRHGAPPDRKQQARELVVRSAWYPRTSPVRSASHERKVLKMLRQYKWARLKDKYPAAAFL